MKYLKFLKKGMVAVAALLVCALTFPVQAQNVTISPTSGSLVRAASESGETGYQLGLASLWRHEQLALSLTTTDRDPIIEASGEIKEPKAVLGTRNGMLTLIGGHRPSFLVVSLPKGYRITGYKIVLVNNLRGNVIPSDVNQNSMSTSDRNGFGNLNSNNGVASGTATMRFFETTRWSTGGTNSQSDYNATTVRYIEPDQIGSQIITQAKAADGDSLINNTTADQDKEYIIERHSKTDTDMTNQLYFRLVKNYYYYGVSIKSFEIYFTAEGTFDDPVLPGAVDHPRSYVTSPFETSKTDIGKMEMHTQSSTGATYYSMVHYYA